MRAIIRQTNAHGTVTVTAASVDRILSRAYTYDSVQRELADRSEGMAIDWSDQGYIESCISLAAIEFEEVHGAPVRPHNV